MGTDPKILNLDELETPTSDIAITHEGVRHEMRVLDVAGFIEQQKRAKETDRLSAEAEEAGDQDMVAVVTIIRDSVSEFFPTLPVDQLPTHKLFVIFAWLNEMSAKMNAESAPSEGEGVAVSAEGNAEAVQS